MKKMMLAGLLLALGSTSMAADSAQSILKKAREDYYKEQEAQRKAGRVSERAGKVKKEKAPESVDESETVEEEVKPRTAMEKLEYNANRAAEKVDFYERVVRSVEREEKELEGYDNVLKSNKQKEKSMKKADERRGKVQKKKK